jgi:hypothetical protein
LLSCPLQERAREKLHLIELRSGAHFRAKWHFFEAINGKPDASQL